MSSSPWAWSRGETVPDVLDLPSRRRVYEHVARFPGKYLRELQRDLGMGMGALEYHLAELEHARLVSCLEGGHKRYFPVEVPPTDRPLLAAFRQEIPRRIVVLLLENTVATKALLAETLSLPTSTLNYHLRRLIDGGFVEAGRQGRDADYRLRDPATVVRLLVTHRSSLVDRMVDAFLEATGELR